MFYQLSNSNRFVQLAAISPLWIVLGFTIFYFDFYPISSYSSSHLYNYTIKLLNNIPLILKIIIFLMLVFQSIMISIVMQNHELISKDSFIPTFVYCVILISNPTILTITPVHFANTFLILFLYNIFITYDEERVSNTLFISSMFVSIAILFYFHSIFFLFLLFISLFIFSNFNFRSVVGTIMGIIFPYIYLISYYFISDQLVDAYTYYSEFIQNPISFNLPAINSQTIPFIVISLFTVIMSIIHILSAGEKLIRFRKKFQFINIYVVISLLISFITNADTTYQIAIIYIPSSLLISTIFEVKKWDLKLEIISWLFFLGSILLFIIQLI